MSLSALLDRLEVPRVPCLRKSVIHPPAPPTLTPEEQDDIAEAVEERAAIREFDAGEDRAAAEAKAASGMKVFRLLVNMGEGQEPRWVVMLAPNTDLSEAERVAHLKFPGRVLAVIPSAQGA